MLLPTFAVAFNLASAAVQLVLSQFLGQLADFGIELIHIPRAFSLLALPSTTFWPSLPSTPTLSLPTEATIFLSGENNAVRCFYFFSQNQLLMIRPHSQFGTTLMAPASP